MNAKLFDRVALIGIGLIGSSLARALRRDSPGTSIVACARRPETLATVHRLELADETTDDPAVAAADADLVVIATPLSAYAEIGQRIAPALQPGAILTDVGSVKQAVIRDLRPHVPPGVHFVPGHPVAGTEHSGPEAGFAELFRDRWCILIPLPETAAEAVADVGRMWERAGMRVVTMSADHHDKVLAMTSHLPHLIAYTIVGTATNLEESLKSEVIEFSASGFRDFTRIAASDPVMWRDVFLNNREAVLEIVERFTEDLTALQRAIRWGEGDKLRSSLPAPARSVVRSSRRSRPERARRTYSQVIRGTLPSFAGPRNICPFWIVNAVLISGLPSGPALASNVSAMRASPASVARICPFCTSAVRIWSYPWTPRRSRRSAGAPGRGRSSPSPSH